MSILHRKKNSNFNKRKNPTTNCDKFLNKTSEIGFAKKFEGFICFVQDAQVDLPKIMEKTNIVDKFLKLSKIGFSMERFAVDFLKCLSTTVKICLSDDQLGT